MDYLPNNIRFRAVIVKRKIAADLYTSCTMGFWAGFAAFFRPRRWGNVTRITRYFFLGGDPARAISRRNSSNSFAETSTWGGWFSSRFFGTRFGLRLGLCSLGLVISIGCTTINHGIEFPALVIITKVYSVFLPEDIKISDGSKRDRLSAGLDSTSEAIAYWDSTKPAVVNLLFVRFARTKVNSGDIACLGKYIVNLSKIPYSEAEHSIYLHVICGGVSNISHRDIRSQTLTRPILGHENRINNNIRTISNSHRAICDSDSSLTVIDQNRINTYLMSKSLIGIVNEFSILTNQHAREYHSSERRGEHSPTANMLVLPNVIFPREWHPWIVRISCWIGVVVCFFFGMIFVTHWGVMTNDGRIAIAIAFGGILLIALGYFLIYIAYHAFDSYTQGAVVHSTVLANQLFIAHPPLGMIQHQC